MQWKIIWPLNVTHTNSTYTYYKSCSAGNNLYCGVYTYLPEEAPGIGHRATFPAPQPVNHSSWCLILLQVVQHGIYHWSQFPVLVWLQVAFTEVYCTVSIVRCFITCWEVFYVIFTLSNSYNNVCLHVETQRRLPYEFEKQDQGKWHSLFSGKWHFYLRIAQNVPIIVLWRHRHATLWGFRKNAWIIMQSLHPADRRLSQVFQGKRSDHQNHLCYTHSRSPVHTHTHTHTHTHKTYTCILSR